MVLMNSTLHLFLSGNSTTGTAIAFSDFLSYSQFRQTIFQVEGVMVYVKLGALHWKSL